MSQALATLAPVATLAPATLATLAPLTWGTTGKKGITVQHAAHSATSQALAPKAVRVGFAMSHDSAQLQNGNYSAVRECVALFKGKQLAELQRMVTGALSQVQTDGSVLAPVIDWGNIRVKTHAVAVAREVCNMADLKGKKATMQGTMRAWLNVIDASL